MCSRSPQHCIQVAINGARLYEALTAPHSDERTQIHPRLGQTGQYVHSFAIGRDMPVMIDCIGFLNREDAKAGIEQALETLKIEGITVAYLETQLVMDLDR